MAEACPSPHPAGNLGGALRVSVCAAAPAGWSERAHCAAGSRRELGAGRGRGPGRLPAAAAAPGELRASGAAAVPHPWPSGIPLDGSGDLCLRPGAGGRRGSRGRRAGECLALCRGELATGRDAGAGGTPCPMPMPALPPPRSVTAEGSRAPSLTSKCEEANAFQASQPVDYFGKMPYGVVFALINY